MRRPAPPRGWPTAPRREVCSGRLLGLAAATVVVEIGGVCVAILGDGSFDLAAAATRTLTTLGVGLLALPLLLGVDRGLTRRRLA